jgi:hypothetical protein
MKRLLLGLGLGTGLGYLLSRLAPLLEDSPGATDDTTLVDRVRSQVFREVDVPKGNVNVNAEQGKVILRGEVENEDLIHDLVERTRRVEGVQDVESLLHTPGSETPAQS